MNVSTELDATEYAIVIPAYNEADSLGAIIARIHAAMPGAPIEHEYPKCAGE